VTARVGRKIIRRGLTGDVHACVHYRHTRKELRKPPLCSLSEWQLRLSLTDCVRHRWWPWQGWAATVEIPKTASGISTAALVDASLASAYSRGTFQCRCSSGTATLSNLCGSRCWRLTSSSQQFSVSAQAQKNERCRIAAVIVLGAFHARGSHVQCASVSSLAMPARFRKIGGVPHRGSDGIPARVLDHAGRRTMGERTSSQRPRHAIWCSSATPRRRGRVCERPEVLCDILLWIGARLQLVDTFPHRRTAVRPHGHW
jgi:hypothetical protein